MTTRVRESTCLCEAHFRHDDESARRKEKNENQGNASRSASSKG